MNVTVHGKTNHIALALAYGDNYRFGLFVMDQ